MEEKRREIIKEWIDFGSIRDINSKENLTLEDDLLDSEILEVSYVCKSTPA